MSRRTKAEMRWRFAEEAWKGRTSAAVNVPGQIARLLSDAHCEPLDVVPAPAMNRAERRRRAAIERKARRGSL